MVAGGLLRQSDNTILRDAGNYWDDLTASAFHSNSHWKGSDGIPDEIWSRLGEKHVQLFREHLLRKRTFTSCKRILEWGCGGGANAVHFASQTGEFIGVDVSQYSLVECSERLSEIGFSTFIPVHIDIAKPEVAMREYLGTCDLFLCTYVFELFPGRDYGERILRLAHALLRPGGVALIQIKYQTHERRTRSRRWKYASNLANMTTYSIEEFWEMADNAGFAPSWISLRLKDTLVNDERYAYYLLDKPEAELLA